jgi:hypothetical protein
MAAGFGIGGATVAARVLSNRVSWLPPEPNPFPHELQKRCPLTEIAAPQYGQKLRVPAMSLSAPPLHPVRPLLPGGIRFVSGM